MGLIITSNTSEEFNSKLSLGAKQYLVTGGKLRKGNTNNKPYMYFSEYPDIDFTIDEIKDIVNDEIYKSFIDSKLTRDMLVNTGYTETFSEPLVKDSSQFISDKPDMVKAAEEYINNQEVKVEEPVKTAEPQITRAPKMMPKAKTLSKKNSGFADVVVLALIVIVYIAIIVNLVIRLK